MLIQYSIIFCLKGKQKLKHAAFSCPDVGTQDIMLWYYFHCCNKNFVTNIDFIIIKLHKIQKISANSNF